MKRYILVFDVESVGLHGPAFAVGWAVLRLDTLQIESEGILAVLPDSIRVDDEEGLKWVLANVNIHKADYNCTSPLELRSRFWKIWESCPDDTLLAADVPWPVEANFLSQCVHDDLPRRAWKGPYPLIDIASFRLGGGEAAMETEDRKPNELPTHNPLCDARQSARQLAETIGFSVRGVNLLQGL